MRKVFLMLTVSLFSLNAGAQECVDAPDCTELGYTQTEADCPNGSIKCPWNSGLVFCGCNENYQYSCTGTNETAGDSKCGDYYASCNCASGYEWKEGRCVSSRPKCNIGDIFYSDNTCVPSSMHDSSKTVLGIVFYVNSDGVGGQIMAPWSVDEYGKPVENNNTLIAQSIRNVSVPGLYACPAGTYVCQKMVDSCNATNIIVAAGGANVYPAAWAAKRYAPTPETAGKWCLPAGFMLLGNMNRYRSIFDISISVINASYFPTQMWSSSQTGDGSFWALEDDNILSHYKMTTKLPVRPVMEF